MLDVTYEDMPWHESDFDEDEFDFEWDMYEEYMGYGGELDFDSFLALFYSVGDGISIDMLVGMEDLDWD